MKQYAEYIGEYQAHHPYVINQVRFTVAEPVLLTRTLTLTLNVTLTLTVYVTLTLTHT